MKVNYSISIKSGCKSAFLHGLNQVSGVSKMIQMIWVRMISSKIFKGSNIDDTLCASSNLFAKYAADIRRSLKNSGHPSGLISKTFSRSIPSCIELINTLRGVWPVPQIRFLIEPKSKISFINSK